MLVLLFFGLFSAFLVIMSNGLFSACWWSYRSIFSILVFMSIHLFSECWLSWISVYFQHVSCPVYRSIFSILVVMSFGLFLTCCLLFLSIGLFSSCWLSCLSVYFQYVRWSYLSVSFEICYLSWIFWPFVEYWKKWVLICAVVFSGK